MIDPDKIFGRLGNRLFQMAFLYAQHLDGKIPDIYLQDPEHFAKYRDAIRAWYRGNVQRQDTVAIHVRRGDYVGNPFYTDLTAANYYPKAMAQFPEGTRFKVYSDDIDWCKRQDMFEDCLFSTNTDPIADLNEMAGSKGVICANSSFSWWGGYLCNGRVVCPFEEDYYRDGIIRTKFPKEWQRI